MIAAGGVLAAVCVALPAARQARQITPPAPPSLTFRSAANDVEIDAIVADAAGRAVPDLGPADFRVSEDGRPQNLSVCAFVDIPVAPRAAAGPGAGATPAVDRDVESNEQTGDGRIFTIVLDGYHVATSRVPLVRRDADAFIDRYLGDRDLAAVVLVGSPMAGQEFTGNRRLLHQAVARFTGQVPLPSSTLNVNATNVYRTWHGQGPDDPDAIVRDFMARESLGAVARLADYMGALHGRRKAVLFFSEGIDLDLLQVPPTVSGALDREAPLLTNPGSVLAAEHDVIAAASTNGISLYPIDPRGLTDGTEDMALVGTVPATDGDAPDTLTAAVVSGLAGEQSRARDSLRMLADETGGLALVDRSDIDAVFERVLADNSRYYVLGFAPADPRHDGRYHRLSVTVTRPGLTVRTRHGYVAPDSRDTVRLKALADPIEQLIVSPAPIPGLPMRVSAGVVKGLAATSTVHLTVEFGGRDLALRQSGGLFTNDLEVEYIAVDAKGDRQAGGRDVAHLQLQPETRASLAARGVRYVTEFDVPPGRYQVRVAAREQLGGRTGSVFYDLDVPDVAAEPFAMSDLLLTSSEASLTPTPNGTSSIGALLPAPTTTARTFPSNATLTVAAFVYDHLGSSPHDVRLRLTVHSADGAEVFAREAQPTAAAVGRAPAGFPWVVTVPLSGLPPGSYRLTMDARSSPGGSARRETVFDVK